MTKLKAAGVAAVALSLGCVEPGAPSATEVEAEPVSGEEVGMNHAIYFMSSYDYDADGDGVDDTTASFFEIISSDDPALCAHLEELYTGDFWFDNILLSYAYAVKLEPLGQATGFRPGEEIFGDYTAGTWVDQGFAVISGGQIYASTSGIGDGYMKIVDIGEASVSGFAAGVSYFDFSGQYALDYDYDQDGVNDASLMAPTPVVTSVTGASRCQLSFAGDPAGAALP
jgi:hypothetical protein